MLKDAEANGTHFIRFSSLQFEPFIFYLLEFLNSNVKWKLLEMELRAII